MIDVLGNGHNITCRPPHGGRGLKSTSSCTSSKRRRSPSSRRAWIEMHVRRLYLAELACVALLTEGVD